MRPFPQTGMGENYKSTLNLPRTAFPMRANLAKREPARAARWETDDLYRRLQEKNRGGPPFILHDGPPFANGDLHLGHALNKTLKEIVLRYKAARGFRAPYVPGWDCHGLPIEHKVAQELQAEQAELSPADLRRRCDAFSEHWIERQRDQFKRLGVLADWEREYKTKHPAYEAEILQVLADFVEAGMVYRSKKPVYWSIPCKTALAEAEIEYRYHGSPSIWVAFPVPDAAALGVGKPLAIVIWTTTPWTIPANLAIAVNPKTNYALLDAGDRVLVVASELAASFAEVVGIDSPRALRELPGRELEGVQARHPFIDRASPVVLADYVTTESGTGCVHTAPGHGLDDYLTGLSYGLETYCPVDDDGRYVDDGRIPPSLVGASVLEENGRSAANAKTLELLRDSGALLARRSVRHSYPHCWRSKTPVVFRAVDQWFVALDKNEARQKALEAISRVRWIPAWGENRIRGAVATRPDWCISRQRSWGVPIPAFYDEEGGAYLDASVARAIADKVAQRGSNLWFESDAETLLEGVALPEAWQGKRLQPGTDTLDVWIDSGTSHLAVLKKEPDLSWPCDLYLEGSDQHRGWFQSSLWTGVLREGRAPYKSILTHGFIVKEDGTKLSKSDPEAKRTLQDYMDTLGADVARLWIASTDFRNDVAVGDKILANIGETYRLFRNTLRFQISNLYDFDPARDAISLEGLTFLDRWILHKTALLARACEEAYENFEYHRVYQLINQFCAVTLSALYHDVLKDRLYTYAAADPARRSAQTALRSVFQVLVRLLGPILPFTADEAWAYFAGDSDFAEEPLLLQGWVEHAADWLDEETAADMEALLEAREEVNERLEGLRRKGEIGRSLDARLRVVGNPQNAAFRILRKREAVLEELFIVSQVELASHLEDETTLTLAKADGGRCPRCWRWFPELENGTSNQKLCPRCREALAKDSLTHA